MRQMQRALVVAATAAAVMVVPVGATTASADPEGVALQHRLDDVVAAGAVGTLAEVRDGKEVWRGSSGVAELGSPRPVPVRGRFRAGSITKTFVATVVLQLVGEGSLRLDDPVERWLPGVVPDGDRITLRHLLDHTSGLYDVVATLPMPPEQEFYDNRWRTWTASELVERALAHPPTSEPPGTAFAYTSTGYLLLGQVVEQATGRPWADAVERRIIRPLHLHGTSLPGASPRITGPHPHGYVPQVGGGLLDWTEMNPSVMGASGELISTTRDLNRFFAALLGGRLLPDDLVAEMQTPGVEGGRAYGLGLAWRDTSCGVRIWGNDGDALAYQSWSFTTADGTRRATIALTPDFRGDPDDAVGAFLDTAFCG